MLLKIFSLILILYISLTAQLDSTLVSIPEVIIEDESNTQNLIHEYLNSPLDINQVSASELSIFPFLTTDQIKILIGKKPFYKKREVQNILGVETYRLFRQYFFVGIPYAFLKWHFLSRIRYPIQKPVGIIKKVYPGPAYDLYTRFRFSLGESLAGGILIQKDPGETEHWDHISGFITWSGFNNHIEIIIGNFIIHAGQDLIYSSPFSQQKSASAGSAMRSRNFYSRSYLTSNETSGFMGVCTGLRLTEDFLLTAFYSKITRDATVAVPGKITGFAISGLHRTMYENTNRDILTENTVGGVAEIQISNNLRIGAVFMHTGYNPAINLKHELDADSKIRNKFFGFNGTAISSYSTYYSLNLTNCNISAEIATNHLNNISTSFVFLYSFKRWKLGFRFWQIASDFKSPHGRVFNNQSSFPAGERGFYFGFSGKISKTISADIYWNPVKKLWRSYFEPFPPTSNNFFSQFVFKLKSGTILTSRFQYQKKTSYISESHQFETKIKKRYRLQFDHKINTRLQLRSRFSYIFLPTTFNHPPLKGLSYFQEIRTKISKYVQLIFRVSSFKSDDYESRTFELEHSLAGSSSLATLYNSGIRWYAILKVNITPSIQISVKYRRIKYNDIDSIGSGLDMIGSDMKEEAGIQIRISG